MLDAVLCISFSMNGKYLASGTDGNNLVLIWEKDSVKDIYRSNVFGSEEKNLETWSCLKRLTGHDSDVVDLCWSPDDTFLATCGLDCVILIWDVKTFELVKRLEGHKGFVKGICWDPIGKFLASQSDDKSVIIWNTSDWSVFKKITTRLEKQFGQTFFKRLCWSPDGSQLCAVHAVDQSKYVITASVIGRVNWDEEAALIGHKGVIECAVKFCFY
jgi:protein HIRA/HIR1